MKRAICLALLALFLCATGYAAEPRESVAAKPLIKRIDPGTEPFDFPRISNNQKRPELGARPLACDTTCYCDRSCPGSGDCVASVSGKCRNNLYCDDCSQAPACGSCIPPP